MTFTLQQAQTRPDDSLAKAEDGSGVVVDHQGESAVPYSAEEAATDARKRNERVLGQDRGLVEYDDNALAPLTDEELAEYGFGLLLTNTLPGEEADVKKAS